MDKILEIKDLHVNFNTEDGRVQAIDGVSFDIQEGEVFGLVGESGCGKSVTALSILRLIAMPPGEIVSGEILFNRVNLLNIPEERLRQEYRGNQISMIFQDPMTSLNPIFKIVMQMLDPLRIHQGFSRKEAVQRSIRMLKRVRIPSAEDLAFGYPHQYSGGMKQRVMIAMALSCNPKLLIADEPTTALDVTIQAQILHLLREINKERNISILFITHDLAVIAEMCHRVGVMYAGNIVEYADVVALFENPLHPYTRGLLECLPEMAGRSQLQPIEGVVPDLIHPPSGCRFHPRCPRAGANCVSERPKLRELAPGHMVSCHDPMVN